MSLLFDPPIPQVPVEVNIIGHCALLSKLVLAIAAILNHFRRNKLPNTIY